MSFRKRTIAKPNLPGQRKKTEVTNLPEVIKDDPVPKEENSVTKSQENTTEAQTKSGTKLSKRRKICPKLAAKPSLTKPNDPIVNETKPKTNELEECDQEFITSCSETKIELSVENVDSSSICSKEPRVIETEEGPDTKAACRVNDLTSEKMQNIDCSIKSEKKSNTTSTTPNNEETKKCSNSKLQKRKRIVPKLTIPKRKSKSDDNVTDEIEVSQSYEVKDTVTTEHVKSVVSNNLNDNSNEYLVDSTSDTKCLKDLPPANDKNTSDHLVYKILAETDKRMDNESLSDSDDKKTPRHVHFDKSVLNLMSNPSKNITANNHSNNTDLQQTTDTCKRTTDNALTNSAARSEAEITTQGSNRNKKFQPNLGARRRKRLSSFSAYSSADEDVEMDGPPAEEVDPETQTKNKKPKFSKKKRPKIDKENEKNADEEDNSTKKKQRANRRTYTEEKDLGTLTMQELIHYRPKSLKKVQLRVNKDQDATIQETAVIPGTLDVEEEEESKGGMKNEGGFSEDEAEEIMAPQVMLNENGEIVINEKSLMIKKKTDDSILRKKPIVFEDSLSGNNHRRKVSRVKRWKMEETLRFYKALSQIGTDFTLMSQAFGRFSRNELKKKFKQEEKVNCDLIDLALSNRLPLNMELFLHGKAEMNDILESNAKATKNNNKDENEDEDMGEGESVHEDGNLHDSFENGAINHNKLEGLPIQVPSG